MRILILGIFGILPIAHGTVMDLQSQVNLRVSKTILTKYSLCNDRQYSFGGIQHICLHAILQDFNPPKNRGNFSVLHKIMLCIPEV